MPTLDDVSALIEGVYATIDNPAAWTAFLSALRDLTHSSDTVVQMLGDSPEAGQLEYSVGVDPYYQGLYAQHYGAMNPWVLTQPHRFFSGEMFDGAEIVPVAELEKTEFYSDFMRPQNLVHTVGCCIMGDGQSGVSIAIARGEEPYTRADRRLMRLLRPHIARAYECAWLVGRTRDVTGAMADRLDRHGTAAYLVGEDGAVRALNPTAERLLADRDPPLWLDASGRLRARGSACDRTLQRLLRGVLAADLPASGGTLVVDRLETSAVLVDVSPVAKRTVQSASRGALVFTRELRAATAISEERLQLLYGLTAAEAGVARLLALGLALPAIADELGISRETVRTHIKRILSKTGTRRQAELCLLLAKSS